MMLIEKKVLFNRVFWSTSLRYIFVLYGQISCSQFTLRFAYPVENHFLLLFRQSFSHPGLVKGFRQFLPVRAKPVLEFHEFRQPIIEQQSVMLFDAYSANLACS